MTATATKNCKPAVEQSTSYQGLFDYFNAKLFDGQLPPCFLNFSRLSARTLGFFAPNTWTRGEGAEKLAEISINPNFLSRGPADALSTLVHEMVHHWQEAFGKSPRRCYHDRQWATKMEEIGLMPSDTGAPGGKKTGQSMDHYIIESGPYARAFASIPDKLLLPWKTCASLGDAGDAEKKKKEKEKKEKQKRKYLCLGCEAKVWGKPGMSIRCGDCDEAFEEQE